MARMQQAAPDPALEAAYRRTRYEVLAPEGLLLLQLDVHNPGLLTVHERLGVRCSAFLTAWNPRSMPQPPAQNAAALKRMQRVLAGLGLECWPGWGRDPTGAWPAEESLFVPGLALAVAQRLGREFDQHAIVHALHDAVPRLLWLTPGGAS